jgi:hypothetical protein
MASEVETRTAAEAAQSDSYSQRKWPLWAWAMIALGSALRLRQFLTNRSLWFDEAALALNVIHRPFHGLWKPLDYHQGAPIGFLLVEKLVSQLVGTGELALRLVPLLAGIAALFIFLPVARSYVSGKALPLALFLFALCSSVVYYSSEAKQYSSDALVSLLLLWVAARMVESPLTARQLFGFSAAGALAIWFSHPASVVLAGAGIAILLAAVAARDWRRVQQLAPILVAWAASFFLCYVVSLRSLGHDGILLNYWAQAFPPRSQSLLATLSWLSDKFIAAFGDPASVFPILGAAFFCAGCWHMMRRRTITLGLLATPLLVLLLASFVRRYPLQGRLLLFITPILLLVISEGAMWAYEMIEPFSRLLGVVLVTLLLLRPAYLGVDAIVHPRHPDDIKPVIRYIETHQEPGDVYYVYYGARYQFAYYSERYPLPAGHMQMGADCGSDPTCYAANIEPLRGNPRTWIVLSHILIDNGIDEGRVLTDQLDSVGTRLQGFQASGARAFLYALTEPKKSP